MDVGYWIFSGLAAFWIMVPAYVPNSAAALLGGGTPIDFGRTCSDGKRVFGDGKTYRGFFGGVLCGVLVGLVQIWIWSSFGLTALPHHTLLSVMLLAAGEGAGRVLVPGRSVRPGYWFFSAHPPGLSPVVVREYYLTHCCLDRRHDAPPSPRGEHYRLLHRS